MKMVITAQSGHSYTAKAKEVAFQLNRYLELDTLFSSSPMEEWQTSDVSRMIRDTHVGSNQWSYDPYDYGDGVDGADEYDDYDLGEFIKKIDSKLLFHRWEISRLIKTTKSRIELAKQGKIAKFSWKNAWQNAKEQMAEQGRLIRVLQSKRRNIINELKARNAECNPTQTKWFTSDMRAACSAEEMRN